jgi:hypothetical protein
MFGKCASKVRIPNCSSAGRKTLRSDAKMTKLRGRASIEAAATAR